MNITYTVRGSTATAFLQGELDHHAAQEARRQLDLILRDPGIRQLRLELSELDFMDSSGIGMILGRYKKLRDRGGKLVLMRMKPSVNRVLELSGIYQLMEKDQ